MEPVVWEPITPVCTTEHPVNKDQSWMNLFITPITPSVEAPLQMQLKELQILQEPTHFPHEPAVQATTTLIHRFVDEIKIPTQQPWAYSTRAELP
jgi:hypothetical protein